MKNMIKIESLPIHIQALFLELENKKKEERFNYYFTFLPMDPNLGLYDPNFWKEERQKANSSPEPMSNTPPPSNQIVSPKYNNNVPKFKNYKNKPPQRPIWTKTLNGAWYLRK